MKKPLIYVAGPLTSNVVCDLQIEHNITRACDMAIKLRELGCTPIVTHLLWHMDKGRNLGYDFYIQWDLDLIEHCDAIIVLPGESHGVNIEEDFCLQENIPILHSLEELQDFLDLHFQLAS